MFYNKETQKKKYVCLWFEKYWFQTTNIYKSLRKTELQIVSKIFT